MFTADVSEKPTHPPPPGKKNSHIRFSSCIFGYLKFLVIHIYLPALDASEIWRFECTWNYYQHRCLNPQGLLYATLYHPCGTPWRGQVGECSYELVRPLFFHQPYHWAKFTLKKIPAITSRKDAIKPADYIITSGGFKDLLAFTTSWEMFPCH